MENKMVTTFRAAVLALLLMFGTFGFAPTAFQGTAAAQTDATQPADDEDDGGFDDWGLLGLLGLAGLAGLLKRPTRDVVVDDTGRGGSVRR